MTQRTRTSCFAELPAGGRPHSGCRPLSSRSPRSHWSPRRRRPPRPASAGRDNPGRAPGRARAPVRRKRRPVCSRSRLSGAGGPARARLTHDGALADRLRQERAVRAGRPSGRPPPGARCEPPAELGGRQPRGERTAAGAPPPVSARLGRDPAGWRSDVPVWEEVTYRDRYAGLDLVMGGDPAAFWHWPRSRRPTSPGSAFGSRGPSPWHSPPRAWPSRRPQAAPCFPCPHFRRPLGPPRPTRRPHGRGRVRRRCAVLLPCRGGRGRSSLRASGNSRPHL